MNEKDPSIMNQDKSFEVFLEEFVQKLQTKEEQCSRAYWILETTGSKDAADLVASLGSEYKVLFSNEDSYKKQLIITK